MASRHNDFSKVPGTKEIIKSVMGSKANVHFNSKKIWRELNLPTSTYDLSRPNIFSLPEKLLKHSAKLKPLRLPHERKAKSKIKSELKIYMKIKEVESSNLDEILNKCTYCFFFFLQFF